MIGLDTNVLIRYIVQDDEYQARIATDFIENECSKENPAFINEVTMCEIVWVLKRAYRYDKSIILNIIQQILSNNEIRVASHRQAKAAFYPRKISWARIYSASYWFHSALKKS